MVDKFERVGEWEITEYEKLLLDPQIMKAKYKLLSALVWRLVWSEWWRAWYNWKRKFWNITFEIYETKTGTDILYKVNWEAKLSIEEDHKWIKINWEYASPKLLTEAFEKIEEKVEISLNSKDNQVTNEVIDNSQQIESLLNSL